jgi:SOS-response transcriptional repressor LexA
LLLRLMRLHAGVDQQRLAARLGVSQPTISRWELGRGGPDGDQLGKWLMLCQVAQAGRGGFDRSWFNAALRALQAAYGLTGADGKSDQPVGLTADELQGQLRRLGLELLTGSEAAAGAGPAADGPGPGQPGAVSLATRQPAALLPLYADVAAGLGEAQEARQAAREQLAVPPHILDADPGAYALRVRGDSMAPLLLEGDAVIVSPASELYDGCLVAAYVEPDGDVVKRLHMVGRWPGAANPGFADSAAPQGRDGEASLPPAYPEALLLPLNPAYPAIRLGGEHGREGRIWGRVVLLIREL